MTLRDLTDKQRDKLQLRCWKDYRQYLERLEQQGKHYNNSKAFEHAFSQGLKAGLELAEPNKTI